LALDTFGLAAENKPVKTRLASSVFVAVFAACHFIHGPACGAGETEPSWPAFHGADRLNMSQETGLLKEWPEGGPKLLWTYDNCGRGYSGVSIACGMIFTAGDFAREERLIGLDMDGKLRWEVPNGEPWKRPCPGSRATPTFDDGKLYQMGPHGRLASFDAKTGKEIWSVDLVEKFDAKWGIWSLAENVIVDGDKLLCMPGGPGGRIVALDKNTGETVWTNNDIAESAAYCSPVIVTHEGVRQMLTMTQRSVLGIEVESGKMAWSAPFIPRSPQNALTPLYHDGHVFVACGHSSGGSLMKIDQDAKTAETVWHREDLDNCHSGTLYIDGKLFGSACRQGGRHFYCVDYLTGKTLKLDKSLGKVGMTAADGMIYTLGHHGTVSLIEVTDDGFEVASQFDLPKKPSNYYLAHPVICGGRLYLRGGEKLWVYDVRKSSSR
jgi:outer membrane protein assembly factor BamB